MQASVTRRNGSALIGAARWAPALKKSNENEASPTGEEEEDRGPAFRERKVPVADTADWVLDAKCQDGELEASREACGRRGSESYYHGRLWDPG